VHDFDRRLGTGLAVLAILVMAMPARAESVPSPAAVPLQSFDAGSLHVDRFGKGDHTVVLIPGLACGRWVWDREIAKLSPNHSVYAITLPGFDGRPGIKEESLFTAFKRDFWEMLKTQKIEKPVVIGHSLGGTMAIALGEEHSERLSGIIAADGMPVFPSFANVTPEQRKTAAKQMAGNFETMSKDDLFNAMKSYMSMVGTNKPELIELAARQMARSDPKAIAAWTQEDTAIDLRPNLTRLTAPFLVIVPYDPSEEKQDGMSTAKQKSDLYKEILKGAPQARVTSVSPSLHFMMLDQPDAFEKTVSEFLSSIHW
jgi:pimeloyl-ACP methyl ester carboxylesterase